ncbi:MAG: peptidase M28 [Planctomycetes bacterium]|nr:peptidase M28 [Planctomycetota bacterium]
MWEQIRSNRRRSAFVVVAMGVLLVVTGLALGAAFGGGGLEAAIVGGGIALAVWFIMWLVSVSQGDQVMLRMAGAREIQKQDHPQYWNVVEEMTIASSLGRMPKVYIVDDPSPNAFATGRKPENAAVAVTTGLLRALDRDELQGVVAHELGHIKNRDVALMVTAGVMMGAIALLAEVGIRAMWFGGMGRRSSRSSNKGGADAAIMIIAIILLILAPIFAQLIYFALSRRREYLADASGAMFTRYPEGLASALEKISGVDQPLADKSRVTAPMYIIQPLRQGATMKARGSLSATHPPIADRVRILRSMGGNAGYDAYESAYRSVRSQNLIGAKTLASAGEVQALAAPAAPKETEPPATPADRARLASNAFLSASGYHRLVCGGCDAILKIPAEVIGIAKACPRCQTSLDQAYPAT